MDRYRLAAPCHFGLESVLKYEVSKVGGEDIEVSDGRVTFSGDERIIARANLALSTAERVLILMGTFKATSFEELFENVKKIPWEEFIYRCDAFPVKGHSLNSTLHSVPDCQSIIKKAIAKRLGEIYHTSWLEETDEVHGISFMILKETVNIYLDTSGAGLHKRGYRQKSNTAPIKETLAAGIIDLARVRENTIFYDPFCGSGTFLIEAAYKALNIAPGIRRSFSAQKWKCFHESIWNDERTRAIDNIKHDTEFFAYGFDNDSECTELSRANAVKAGVKNKIRVDKADIRDFSPSEKGIIVCNPPYGERMLEIKEAEELYKEMGKVFENPAYIISPHEDFEKFFGRKADKRRKLYNGMIKCQLFMYYK